ncbi:SMI1/KNR4 family protein [Hymenobacter cavernae]|uniref:SMI1/KNR4 family protein n=1 Tax=Hymenobacter cavernae TaxID=2044852 RepID=A0ABQ1U810_9BACT|nr:SMI1/KNR4 family protein [Hymenobacter cavernae]GGF12926.1 hypothetical protein GCM10011383_25090 [Hymenobacter cavernae]
MIGILFTGAPITNATTLALLPSYLQDFLRKQNGVVAYFGGLHIRGCGGVPAWHSLEEVWHGPNAFWRTYDTVERSDIPFAQDCLGNQFLLRQDAVFFLDTETGELADLEVDFKHFLFGVEKFPVDALGMQPLRTFQQGGGVLQPGQLLRLYPPACIATKDKTKTSLKAVPNAERLAWLADFYQKIKGLPDGQSIQFKSGE